MLHSRSVKDEINSTHSIEQAIKVSNVTDHRDNSRGALSDLNLLLFTASIDNYLSSALVEGSLHSYPAD
jgi:hypothetical protein